MLSLLLLSLVACVSGLVSPQRTLNCSSFAQSVSLPDYNATFLNATHYPSASLNVSGTLNNVSFVRYVSVSYGSRGNDSLTFAVWLPETPQYNNRFLAEGNGGMAGTIDYVNMVSQLNSGMGLAVSGGNAGHLASKQQRWRRARSLHPLSTRSRSDYCVDPRCHQSVHTGCESVDDSVIRASRKAVLNFTSNAVLDACDGLDGVQDRLIEGPLRCDFDIGTLEHNSTTGYASSNTTITCLTAPQLAVVKAFYAGPTRSDNGSELYPGFSFGSESGRLLQEGYLADAFSIPILQNLLTNDLSYDSDTFNWASDVSDVGAKAGTFIDEISPNLIGYRNCGGKMILTQGWADPLKAAIWPFQHLEQTQDFYGEDVSDL